MTKPILLIDDEEEFLRSVSFTLRISGYPDVETCVGGSDCMRRLAGGEFSLVILDIMMPDISGRELLPRITAEYPDLPVIMSTAVNEVEVAVDCMRNGAFDYLVKPIDKARLVTSVQKALQYSELARENVRLAESFVKSAPENSSAFSHIIADSDIMKTMFRYIEAISPTTMPVLILGETGSGKELAAQAVHKSSQRGGSFVAVNVAGLDDTLFADTLFGHERGAFTGAEKKREGLIAKAAGGTLFLDEIGDLKIETQVKLLRLIEERTYYSVGSDTTARCDARIVVATSVDLVKAVAEGKFRKDLYYRLKSHTVRIPPLRERKQDIAALAAYFFRQAAGELKRGVPTVPPQLYQLLRNYSFPGNVRELRGMVFDALSRHSVGVLSLDVFKEQISGENFFGSIIEEELHVDSAIPVQFGDTLPTLKECDDALVREAMRRTEDNQSLAARLLGITPSALNKRLNK